MRMADFWLTEKDLVHKLFKVLAPRFQPHPGSYTRMLHIPSRDCLDRAKMAVIELKGNPFPPLIRPRRDSEKTLLNQLLKGCREDAQRAAGP
uniref:Large ribosomal subunit protein bL17m n=1 Tax=Chrysolophus pictus TaxID=9089 RepID=A0A8C3L407_CHRPC